MLSRVSAKLPPRPKAAPKIEREVRFYITSLVWMAGLMGPVIRSHWAVENSLHWVMDMIFRDDECRIRTDHAPANFTTIKHIAPNLLRRKPGKDPFASDAKRPDGTTSFWQVSSLLDLLTRFSWPAALGKMGQSRPVPHKSSLRGLIYHSPVRPQAALRYGRRASSLSGTPRPASVDSGPRSATHDSAAPGGGVT